MHLLKYQKNVFIYLFIKQININKLYLHTFKLYSQRQQLLILNYL